MAVSRIDIKVKIIKGRKSKMTNKRMIEKIEGMLKEGWFIKNYIWGYIECVYDLDIINDEQYNKFSDEIYKYTSKRGGETKK